ncbi:MAG: peptidylprolyl isomerase, partial [Mobilitalea sp.]
GDTVAEIVIRDYGSINVRFFENAAPKAVENFITLAKEGYYDGLTFHRIIEDFMLQGGDPTGTGSGGESIWGESFKDEFSNDLQPYRGALCMANSGPDTNGSQFFLVQASNTYNEDILDQIEDKYDTKFDDKARVVYGTIGGTPWLFKMHTVFGQIYKGLDVLDLVAKIEKTDAEMGVPATEVIIEKIIVSEY